MRRFLLGLLLLIAFVAAAGADNRIVSMPSRYPVPDTVARLESALKGKGITVFARIDHAAAAKQAGLAMRPAQLLIFGNPKSSTPIMNAVPLKALIWEDVDGKIWLSYNDPGYIKNRFKLPGKVMQPLTDIGELRDEALQ